MKNVNPLHVGVLLVTLLLFLFFKLQSYKEEFKEEQKSLQKTLSLAESLSALKKVYGDKTKTLSGVQRILRHSSLKNAKIAKSIGKNSLSLKSKSIDLKALNFLVSKIFNGGYNVKTLDIKKIDKTHARISMEIQW